MEMPHVYEDLQMEERQNKVTEKQRHNQWLLPVAIASTAVVCFGAGFVVAYFAVPRVGKSLGVDAMTWIKV